MRKNPLNMILLFIGLMLAVPAMADKGDFTLDQLKKDDSMVNIMLGKAEMVALKGNVSDVLVANPSVVDVMAVKSDQLYLVGSALGDTNIMILDEEGNVLRKLNIHVQMDTEKLESMISELYPNESVKIRALTDQLVLTGHVATPAMSNGIANLVAQYAAEVQNSSAPTSIDDVVTNMLVVGGEEQVMLKVKIIEASRSALKDLGLETRLADGALGAVGATIGAAAGLGLTSPVQLGTLALNYNSGSFGPLSFLARALEEEGIINTLASPNLTAISGEQAGFLAGGEIPIPTEVDRNGNLIYEFRPFGVSLNFRPTVMSANRISMELTTEVSSANYDDSLQLQGISVPTFNVRRADTTVELPSGGTLMIAGLLQSDAVSTLTQIPGVGKVPVVGDLLKSDSFQRNESELVVMVTPYLVRPFAENNAAPVAPPEPAKTSGADVATIPRLSMSDLETLPEEDVKTAAAQIPQGPKVPVREKSALSGAFESNIKRTYGARKASSAVKGMDGFGYMTD